MYIYNVTINLDPSIHQEWLTWMDAHIQEVLATGKFTAAKFTQVLVEEDVEGFTYSVQYTAATREDLDDYYTQDAPKLQKESLLKFSDKMLAFRTELKVIKEYYPITTRN